MDGNGHALNPAKVFNGSSLISLAGAEAKTKLVSEVRLPASSMPELLEVVHRLGYTGNLQVNFHKGKALDIKWTATSDTKPSTL